MHELIFGRVVDLTGDIAIDKIFRLCCIRLMFRMWVALHIMHYKYCVFSLFNFFFSFILNGQI